MKKIALLLCLVAFTVTTQAQLISFGKKGERKDVLVKTGTLTLHPDSVTIKAKDGGEHYYFLDAVSKCLFVTANKEIYDSISTFLPVRIILGRNATLQGTVINPFTTYSKKDLDDVSKKLGISLNGYKVAKIFNYGLQVPVIALVQQKEEDDKKIVITNPPKADSVRTKKGRNFD